KICMDMFARKFIPVIIIICLAAGFGGGLLFAKSHATLEPSHVQQQVINQDTGKPQDVDFSLFWKAWNTLDQKYVDSGKVDYQKMLYGAISGMVNSVGDPYTVFFEPVTSKKFQEEIKGSFGGVGIEVGKKNDILTVIAPIKDTPAFKAGIQTGDKIAKIDGKSTAGMAIDDAVNLIRGKKGSKVILTIINSKNEAKDISLIRDTIAVPTVEWKLVESNGKKVAYMHIYAFNENVDSEFKKATDEILKSEAQALIVDLRNNPGGLLDSAINLAGSFVDKGKPVVSEVFGNGLRNDFPSNGNAALKKYPTVLLVNGGSASASEILAGALHDNLNLKLVGEKTFGKGSVQELDNLDGGASLKVTIAKWYTPAGISISEKGIEPDIKVELTDDQKKNIIFGDVEKDPQLQKALDVVTK
ncbi:S41 family peptidase, partial [Candidatus Parcubacteria bacterium]|nr:S41 family peptidase [Candidatus Parcubacteria bacterium]